MTTICLIRHGETDWNFAKRLQGREDIPLNVQGKNSANECGNYLRKGTWDAVVSSPLIRAKETATIIADKLGIVCVDEVLAFIERDYGSASGLHPEDRKLRFPDGIVTDQEDWNVLQDRVMSALASIAEIYKNRKVIIVSHGAVINSVLATISNGSIGSGKTDLKNCCINVINYDDSEWTIDYYNQTVSELENESCQT